MTGDVPITEWKARNHRPHRKQVFCVGWSADGRRLASGSSDTVVRITRLDDNMKEPLFSTDCELRGSTDAVMSVQWHPTHYDRLASISASDKNIRFWDVRSRKNTASMPTPTPNLSLSWSPDGHYMVVGNREDVVSIVDVRLMKILHKYPNKVQVNDPKWSRDMRLFFQGNGNGELEVYQYPEMRLLRALHGHTAAILTLALDKQAKYLATGGGDAVVSLWDLQDFACLSTYTKMDHNIRGLSFSHDSRYLAIAGEQSALDVENVETGTSLGRLPLQVRADDVAWHPKMHMLAFPGAFGHDNVGEYGSIEFRWLPGRQ